MAARAHLEASIGGVVLLLLALVAGRWVAESPMLAPLFTHSGPDDRLGHHRLRLHRQRAAGLDAALPAGLPLDVHEDRDDPAAGRRDPGRDAAASDAGGDPFIDGTGPVFAGKLFPFAFITIACGAISGFHALVASGTTPKMIRRETDARLIGYGGMLMESFVAVMAMCAAAVLDPGVYFAINAPLAVLGGSAEAAAETIRGWGFTRRAGPDRGPCRGGRRGDAARRTGGAPSLAVGMA